MTTDEWDGIELLFEEWWKGDWSSRKAVAYRIALDEFPAQAVLIALRKLTHTGKPWLPTVPEIIAALEDDPSVPTWLEVSAWLLCVGRRRLPDPHPMVLEWVALQGGLSAIDMLPISHPEHGRWEIKRLRESWEQFVAVAAARGRHRSALSGGGQPRQLDPIASLGLARKEITA